MSLGGRPVVLRSEQSGVVFNYRDGTVKFTTDTYPWGLSYWLPSLSDKNVEALYSDYVDSDFIITLPLNVRTILVSDMHHLSNISEWLTGDKLHHGQSDIAVRYIGNHSKFAPKLTTISPTITHLQLPLVQDVSQLLLDNPHIESLGIDLDKYHHSLPPNIQLVVWSSNHHRLKHASSHLSVLEQIQYLP